MSTLSGTNLAIEWIPASAVSIYYSIIQQVTWQRMYPNRLSMRKFLCFFKENLDSKELKNYRSVSNLAYLSKLAEMVVKMQLQLFLDSHDAMPKHQST